MPGRDRISSVARLKCTRADVSIRILALGVIAFLGLLSVDAATQTPIVINEIMYHPLSDIREDEYVELINPTGSTVFVGGWMFADGIVYTFPVGTSIPSGGFLVLAADPVAKGPDGSDMTPDNNVQQRRAKLLIAQSDDLF